MLGIDVILDEALTPWLLEGVRALGGVGGRERSRAER